MSRVIWQSLLVPDMTTNPSVHVDPVYNDQVENVRPYPVASQDIQIPDPKAFRSMSRTAVFLANMCEQARSTMAQFQTKTPFTIGVYAAVENGPIDAPSTAKIIGQDALKFSDAYRKFRNPKMYLKQLPNLIPAQMGIFMNLQGPMNVYTHSTQGPLQALEQAEWDLQNGTVEAALVCTASAFDDFLVMKRIRHFDIRCQNEGAAAMLLVKDGGVTDWASKMVRDEKNFFGIADQLVQYMLKNKKN